MRKISLRSKTWLCVTTIVILAILLFSSPQHASAVIVDFDALDASASSITGPALASYLAGFGISLSGVTPGTNVAVIADQNLYGGTAMDSPSAPNILSQIGSNNPVTFTMNFSSPLDSFSFTRATLLAGPNGITHPAWQAYAFNASMTQLAFASEGLIASFSNVLAATYTLSGPGITSVRFDSQNGNFAAFSGVLLDNLNFTASTASPVPEPSTLLLFGSGLAGLGFFGRNRRKKA